MSLPAQTMLLERLRALGEARDKAAKDRPRVFPMEFRTERRAEGDALPMLVGHGAVFDKWSVPLWGFTEKVKPGAFTESIRDDDVVCLFNHEASLVLGRTSAGTLRLAEDTIGLAFENDPADVTYARDLIVSIDRGDVKGCSFSFDVLKDEWDYSDPDNITRTLLKCCLGDLGPVTFPAYPQTDVAVRSLIQEVRDLARGLHVAPQVPPAPPVVQVDDPAAAETLPDPVDRLGLLRKRLDLKAKAL